MSEALDRVFADFSARKLEQLAGRIEDCLKRLDDSQIWLRSHDNGNSVGNLVLHLCGNVRQWIGHGAGGLADVRQRDDEFEARGGIAGAELAARLRDAVRPAAGIIRGLTAERLGERVTIQNYEATVLEAVYHVVEHFGQHTGQIMFATKLLTGADLGYYGHLRRAAHGEKTP